MAIINLTNLALCARTFAQTQYPPDDPDRVYRQCMRLMGIIFTLVGAYRAVFVSKYITQAAWFDSMANSSLLIRGLAFFAEVSFSGQIALAMTRVNRDLSLRPTKLPYFMWGCIILAQFFATTGVITKAQTAFAIEETLWSIGFLAVIPLALTQWRRASQLDGRFALLKNFTRINLLWCLGYCTWGLTLNLALGIWPEAIAQIKTGLPPIQYGLSAIQNAWSVVHETKAWGDWGFGFLLWHSGYFSVCVWISIFMMKAPRALRP